MLAKFTPIIICALAINSCGTPSPKTKAENDANLLEENLPKCNFQINGIQSLIGSHHKLVGGIRVCDDGGQVSKELVLFAEGEPINNLKECNLFATKDTTVYWEIELSPSVINVLFTDHFPADSNILTKFDLVFDSIEVRYRLANPEKI